MDRRDAADFRGTTHDAGATHNDRAVLDAGTAHNDGAAHDETGNRFRALISQGLGSVETVIYGLLAVLLSAAAFMALWDGAWNLFSTFHFDASIAEVSTAVHELEELLFVLMLVEILHTVKISISSHRLVTEPFLVVAIIASVRRMLVITMESSQLIQDHKWIGDGHTIFILSLWELGVLGLLVLALVTAILAMRRNASKNA